MAIFMSHLPLGDTAGNVASFCMYLQRSPWLSVLHLSCLQLNVATTCVVLELGLWEPSQLKMGEHLL